jgi:hypothetical protein
MATETTTDMTMVDATQVVSVPKSTTSKPEKTCDNLHFYVPEKKLTKVTDPW